MDIEHDIERIIEALERQQLEVIHNMAEQLRAIKDHLRANRGYMARSGRAVMENPYANGQQDAYGVPTRRN
jgi:hypothetical protein